MRFSLALTYVSIAVTALAYPGPAPTQPGHVDLAINGRSPIPTALAGRSDPDNLFRRQSDSGRTCGYFDQDYQQAATCVSGSYCAYNAGNEVFGCCDGPLEDCYLQTACYPSAAAALSCTDSSCQSNPYNLLCTDGAYTYCNVVVSTTSGTGLTNFGCYTEDLETSTVYDYYTNEPSSSVPSIVVQVITSVQTVIQTTMSQPSESPLVRVTSPLSTPSAPPTPSAPSIQVPGSKAKTPIAPIIGGVVGGLAVIIIAIIAAIFLIRRKRSPPPPAAPGAAEYVQPAPVQQAPVQTYDQSYFKQPIQSTMAPQSPYSPPMSPAPPYGTVHAYHAPAPLPHGIAEAP